MYIHTSFIQIVTTMRHLVSILTILFLFPFLTSAQVASYFSPEVYRSEAGDSLLYRWHTPDAYQKDQPQRFPLVIFLHGSGERGNDNTSQLIHVAKRFVSDEMRKDHPAFIIFPQCPKEQRWAHNPNETETDNKPTRQLEMVMELVDRLMKEYPIDRNRIYIGGLSMGGHGTWSALANYSGRFAAGFPICGKGSPSMAPRMATIPIWVFHGDADNTVPVERSREMVRALRKAGGNPVYTEFPGVGHNSWDPALDENPFVYDWIFSQRKWR